MTETTELTEAAHRHSFPVQPPAGSLLKPGACDCGKTHAQHEADKALRTAVGLLIHAYGDAARVSEHWCVAWGGEDANDCAGHLEYDDEAGAREMTRWIEDGFVARHTVIKLPWETVSDKGKTDDH